MSAPSATRSPWQDIRDGGVARAAAALGLAVNERRGIVPCPACGEVRRGSEDKRAAAEITSNGLGWCCWRCKAQGDAVSLAAWKVSGAKLSGGDSRWRQVRDACAAAGLCDAFGTPETNRPRRVPPSPVAVEKKPRPPKEEVEALWRACSPIVSDHEAAAYLRGRGLDVDEIGRLDIARALPADYEYPAWWPISWASSHRIIVQAYEADGSTGSIHARAVGIAKPKTKWPLNCLAQELLMANARGWALLAGESAPSGVLVVEGLTDLLAASVWNEKTARELAVLAIASGSAPALAKVRWSEDQVCYVATDGDAQGEAYAEKLRAVIPAHVEMRRIRFEGAPGSKTDFASAAPDERERAWATGGELMLPPSGEQHAPELDDGGRPDGPDLSDLGSASSMEDVKATLDKWAMALDVEDPLEGATARQMAIGILQNVEAVSGAAQMVDAALEKRTAADRIAEKDAQQQARAAAAAYVEANRFESSVRFTDTYNAELFVEEHGSVLRYCTQMKKWFAWRENRWVADVVAEAPRRLKSTITDMRKRAEQLRNEELREWALASEDEHKRRAALNLAMMEKGVQVLPEHMDADPWALNVLNGTLDLKTCVLRPHRREDMHTKIARVRYDANAKAPVFEAFLQRIFAGDQELIGYLQRFVGYMLTGHVGEHLMLLFHGGGANGKSTLTNLLLELLGNYAKAGAPNLLMQSTHDRHPTELADLHGARLVVCQETDEGARLDESKVKALTGGDMIKARRMREDFWEFPPSHKLILSTNHKPRIRGNDDAIWRRMNLVPFDVQIPKHERDPRLGERLRAELSGVLAWAVEGCRQWQRDGLKPPARVVAATQAYRESEDSIGAFIADCCKVNQGGFEEAGKLYQAFKSWAQRTGEREISQKDFGHILGERGFRSERSNRNGANGRRIWHGLMLAETSAHESA